MSSPVTAAKIDEFADTAILKEEPCVLRVAADQTVEDVTQGRGRVIGNVGLWDRVWQGPH